MEITRCYGCMRELKTPGAVCPHCGYDNTNGPAAQPSHVLPCGTVLNGQYLVGRSLGQGGFGITYIGYDLNLEIPVCIKEYYPEGAAMRSATQSRMVYWGTSENAEHLKQSRKSFVKEAQKAVKLRDLSHVVTVWGIFYENETAYIVMDYIDGETLKASLVRTQTPLDERECIDLLTPIIEDLEKAHARGIVHRDIKPDNIMLKPDGEPMLLDMGAAKDLGKAAQNGGTLSSTMVVSQGFSPVEQYSERGEIGPWTDVYAMSATIYYCMTGKVPPPAIDRSMYGDKVDYSALSPALAVVLEKGLAIKHENRYQSMAELLSALRTAVADERSKSKPEPKPKAELKLEPKSEPKLTPKPKRWIAVLGAVVVLLAAIELVIAELGGEKQKETSTLGQTTAPASVSASSATAASSEKSGKIDALNYEVYSDHVEIIGCGKNATDVNIPAEIEGKPVTSIGDKAFQYCRTLTDVTIPNSVVSIGDRAFSDCDSLTDIIIPNGVTSIGRYVFDGCNALNSVTIPDSVTIIGDNAFQYCASLTSITIPNSVTRIGKETFSHCTSLKSITIPNGVKEAAANLVEGCTNLKAFAVSDENPYYKAIDGVLFTADGKELLSFPEGKEVENYVIPYGATSIGDYAFQKCIALTSITIPDSVTSIGNETFRNCSSLTSISIPDGVTSIGSGAFKDCSSLKDIYFDGTEEQWNAIAIAESNENLSGASIHYRYQNDTYTGWDSYVDYAPAEEPPVNDAPIVYDDDPICTIPA